jgi:hypothetical protein
MQRLEVSGAVRHMYMFLGVKGLMKRFQHCQLRQQLDFEDNLESMLTDLVGVEGWNTETQRAHPFHLTTLMSAATDRRHRGL